MRRYRTNTPSTMRRSSSHSANTPKRSSSRCTIVTAAVRPLPSPLTPNHRSKAGGMLRCRRAAGSLAVGQDITPAAASNACVQRLPRVVVTSGLPTKRCVEGRSTRKAGVLQVENSKPVARRVLASRSLSRGGRITRDKTLIRSGFDPGISNAKKSVTVVLDHGEPYTRVNGGCSVTLPGSKPRSAISSHSTDRPDDTQALVANSTSLSNCNDRRVGEHHEIGAGDCLLGDPGNSSTKCSYYDPKSGRIAVPSRSNIISVSDRLQDSETNNDVSHKNRSHLTCAPPSNNVPENNEINFLPANNTSADNKNNNNRPRSGYSSGKEGLTDNCPLSNNSAREGRSFSDVARADNTGALPRCAAEILQSIDYVPHSRYLCRLMEKHGHLAPLVGIQQNCSTRELKSTTKETYSSLRCVDIGGSGDAEISCYTGAGSTVRAALLRASDTTEQDRKMEGCNRPSRSSPRLQSVPDSRSTCKVLHSRRKHKDEQSKLIKTCHPPTSNNCERNKFNLESKLKPIIPSGDDNFCCCCCCRSHGRERMPKRRCCDNHSGESCQRSGVCFRGDGDGGGDPGEFTTQYYAANSSATCGDRAAVSKRDQICQTSPGAFGECSMAPSTNINQVRGENDTENVCHVCDKQQQSATNKKCIHRYYLDERLFLRPCGHDENECPICVSVRSCGHSKANTSLCQCSVQQNIADKGFELTVPMALFDDNVRTLNSKPKTVMKSRASNVRGSSTSDQQMALLRRSGRGLNQRLRRCRGSAAGSPSFHRLTSTSSLRRSRI